MDAAIAYRLLSIIIIIFFQLVDYQRGLFTSLRSCKSEYVALRCCLQQRFNDGNDTGIVSTGGSLKIVFVGSNWLLIQICENGYPLAITWIRLQIEFNTIALYV